MQSAAVTKKPVMYSLLPDNSAGTPPPGVRMCFPPPALRMIPLFLLNQHTGIPDAPDHHKRFADMAFARTVPFFIDLRMVSAADRVFDQVVAQTGLTGCSPSS